MKRRKGNPPKTKVDLSESTLHLASGPRGRRSYDEELEQGMKEATVEPDVGHQEEHDGRHQDEMGAPDEAGGAWPGVTQDGAHG